LRARRRRAAGADQPPCLASPTKPSCVITILPTKSTSPAPTRVCMPPSQWHSGKCLSRMAGTPTGLQGVEQMDSVSGVAPASCGGAMHVVTGKGPPAHYLPVDAYLPAAHNVEHDVEFTPGAYLPAAQATQPLPYGEYVPALEGQRGKCVDSLLWHPV